LDRNLRTLMPSAADPLVAKRRPCVESMMLKDVEPRWSRCGTWVLYMHPTIDAKNFSRKKT
jgi:hypothetical protein